MKKNSKVINYLQSRGRSLFCALRGVKLLFREPHTIIHLIIASAAIFLAAIFKISSTEWLFLVLSIMLVLTLEAINTALEYTVDLITSEYNDLARNAKDAAAGAVLISALGALIVGFIIFIPKLYAVIM